MIGVTAILPKKFNPLVFREEFLKAGEATIDDFAKDTDKTEYTWKEKAKFNRVMQVASSVMRFQYWTDNKIVGFLEHGTRVRYATMSKDFEAKTKRRFIGSVPGKGRKLFVNKKRPRPGIKAREWFPEIRDRRRLSTISRFNAAMRRGKERCGHGG